MKVPKKAILLSINQEFPIDVIHYRTGQITLKEKEKVYNTVSIKNVRFDYSDFSESEIRTFQNKFLK